ncbi:hypothetical protein BIX66_03225 [Mycoplasmoides pneumoniae]|uniref:Uncharacterized protein n=2 Tax=Mycoplasmoides pneumoniae TaxID=2104 RepID=A0AB38W7U4_MYCPM|nr:conserved hypothetical protein [Mycoplasmoides pneumoniae FH]ALA39585.1 hypothetical protein C680_03200 [Mycoplasmoides pneumoniae PO1]APL98896.1 hypothetical protein BIX66_03225 [Mycoplasmoides pneumoniae]ALA36060.1 hypothetical protein F539_03195 [Mycoplasmoides pneumoniae FH]PFH44491.1 hypothetical protein BIX72_03790 [Mycoplasmoides pneumoniae]
MEQFFQSTAKRKTPAWLTGSFSFFLVFVYYIIVWVLLGEINALGFNFVIAPNNRTLMGREVEPIFDLVLLWFLLVPLVVYALLLLLLFFTTPYLIVEAIPFFYGIALMMISLFMSGMFPQAWNVWVIFGRFVLVLVVLMLSFFVINKLTNLVLLRSRYAMVVAQGLVHTGKVKQQSQQAMSDIKTKWDKEKSKTVVVTIKKKRVKSSD